MNSAHIELLLRSPDATWDYARWERLPDDGNRYEVIIPDAPSGTYAHTAIVRPDGVLESSTLPVALPIAELFSGAPDTTL